MIKQWVSLERLIGELRNRFWFVSFAGIYAIVYGWQKGELRKFYMCIIVEGWVTVDAVWKYIQADLKENNSREVI